MKKIYSFLITTAALCFVCFPLAFLPVGCQTPPDRIALSTVNTGDAALNAAYQAWLAGWKQRRTNEGSSPALLAERDRVAVLISDYQSAHRTAIKAAEAAVNSGITEINVAELLALKGELINVLTHR